MALLSSNKVNSAAESCSSAVTNEWLYASQCALLFISLAFVSYFFTPKYLYYAFKNRLFKS
jgi:hypothetical protein